MIRQSDTRDRAEICPRSGTSVLDRPFPTGFRFGAGPFAPAGALSMRTLTVMVREPHEAAERNPPGSHRRPVCNRSNDLRSSGAATGAGPGTA